MEGESGFCFLLLFVAGREQKGLSKGWGFCCCLVQAVGRNSSGQELPAIHEREGEFYYQAKGKRE